MRAESWMSPIERLMCVFYKQEANYSVDMRICAFWKILSRNTDISPRFINLTYEFPWEWDDVNERIITDDFDINDIINYPRIRWKMGMLTRRTPLNIICAHPDINWLWEVVTMKALIGCDNDASNHICNNCGCTNDVDKSYGLTIYDRYVNINFRFIIENPKLPWTYHTDTELFPLSFIRNNMNLWWNFSLITMMVPIELIYEYPDKNWYWKAITDVEFIKTNINKDWDFRVLTERMDVKFIQEHIKLPWNFGYLTDIVSLDFIALHPKLGWRWLEIAKRTTQHVKGAASKKADIE